MATMANKCNQVPRWLLLLTIAFLVARICFFIVARTTEMPSDAIRWRTYRSVSDNEVLGANKEVLIFLTHGSHCDDCRRVERRLRQPRLAAEIVRRYIPVRVFDSRDPLRHAPEEPENKQLLDSLVSQAPALIVVQPNGWNVNNGGVVENGDQSSLLMFGDWLEDHVTAKPAPLSPESAGFANWRSPSAGLVESHATGKPLFLLFNRTRDLACAKRKSFILNDQELSERLNKFCIPVMITDFTRSGKANSQETNRLIKQYSVTRFPTVCIVGKGKPAVIDRSPSPGTVGNLLDSQLAEDSTRRPASNVDSAGAMEIP